MENFWHNINTKLEQLLRNYKFQQDLVVFKLNKIAKLGFIRFLTIKSKKAIITTKCIPIVSSFFLKSKKNEQYTLIPFSNKIAGFWQHWNDIKNWLILWSSLSLQQTVYSVNYMKNFRFGYASATIRRFLRNVFLINF